MSSNLLSLPEKELIASVNPKEEPINKTYFYENLNGSVIICEEQEAWGLHKKKFKQIGVSNGQLFKAAQREAKQLFVTQGLAAAQARIRKGEQEELEAARGHLETPPNYDVMGPGAQHLIRLGLVK